MCKRVVQQLLGDKMAHTPNTTKKLAPQIYKGGSWKHSAMQ